MKKLTAITLFVFGIFLVSVQAAPFIRCDIDSIITSYVLTFADGQVIEVPAPLHYDLSGIPEGSYIIDIQAKTMWGVSSAVPFEFAKVLPQSPINIQLSEE